jgi:hypothetical protein
MREHVTRNYEMFPTMDDFRALDADGAPAKPARQVGGQTKKDQILRLFRQGMTQLDEIARQVGTRPSYVASVLQAAGLLTGYFDLYTTTNRDQNSYSRFFRGALGFKSVDAARDSVRRIDELYRYFERLGDRAGQHHAEVLALTGRNRARWSGKKEEAEIFMHWLVNH